MCTHASISITVHSYARTPHRHNPSFMHQSKADPLEDAAVSAVNQSFAELKVHSDANTRTRMQTRAHHHAQDIALHFKAKKNIWDETKHAKVRALQAAVTDAAQALAQTVAPALSRLIASLGTHRVPQRSLDALREHWPDLSAKLSGKDEDNEAGVKQKLAWLIRAVVR